MNSKLIAEIKIDNLNEIVAEELGKILNRCTLTVEYEDGAKEPVGRWIKDEYYPGGGYRCSECGYIVKPENAFNYCPECGCRMEVEK